MAVKYKINRIRNKVRVERMWTTQDWSRQDWSNTLDDDDCRLINEWVEQTGCGRRVAYDMWQLKNKEAVMLFILRWGN